MNRSILSLRVDIVTVGSLALWTGLLIGSIAAFFIARLLAQDFISVRLGGRTARFNEQLKENGFSVVLIARLLGLPLRSS